jgi:hypothetical protein
MITKKLDAMMMKQQQQKILNLFSDTKKKCVIFIFGSNLIQ